MILLWVVIGLLACFGLVVLFGAPYVPTLKGELRTAFTELYQLKASDVVVDLGSGDGRVLEEAARRGAKGFGYELNPLLVLLSKIRLRSKATIQLRDMWSVTLPPDTTLVYVFTVSRDTKRLERFLQKQVNARNRSLRIMTFGPTFTDQKPIAALRGHSLYEIRPMQQRSA